MRVAGLASAAGIAPVVAALGSLAAAEGLPPLCNVTEAGMAIALVYGLEDGLPEQGRSGSRPPRTSGVTVDGYIDEDIWSGSSALARPTLPELQGFHGVRVVHCATGRFLAIPDTGSVLDVAQALTTTEFLRPTLQAGGQPSFADVQAAVSALFEGAILMSETAETCACANLFPDLRPGGMTPYADRTDVIEK